jgi:hypothetical protein
MSVTIGLASVAVAAQFAGRTFTFLPLLSLLHAVQLAGARSGIAAALYGTLLLGRHDAYAMPPAPRLAQAIENRIAAEYCDNVERGPRIRTHKHHFYPQTFWDFHC